MTEGSGQKVCSIQRTKGLGEKNDLLDVIAPSSALHLNLHQVPELEEVQNIQSFRAVSGLDMTSQGPRHVLNLKTFLSLRFKFHQAASHPGGRGPLLLERADGRLLVTAGRVGIETLFANPFQPIVSWIHFRPLTGVPIPS